MTKLFVTLFLFPIVILSQNLGLVSGTNAYHFQLLNKNDTVNFLVISNKIDSVKPVLIFCQGSTPMPLIIKQANGTKFITPLTNFNYQAIAKQFHLVVISMPNTPVEVDENKLDKNLCVVTDTSQFKSFMPAYLANNYLNNYVQRTQAVINYLYEQKFTCKKKVLIFGHSQGSKVALGAALNNAKISCVGYAGGNPLGRIDQLIREQRDLAAKNLITKEEAQQQIDTLYEEWQIINQTPNATTKQFGDPNKTWTSFSKPQLDDLLNLNKPLFVAYGTEDIGATFCDLLPLYFITQHKTNLTLKPYVGLEHNFFETDATGKPIYSKGHWQQVITDFIKWAQ